MYISSEILDWDYYVDSSTGYRDDNFKRPYEYWNHAEKILKMNNCDEFNRIDAISNLKRAIDHRLKELNKLYKLDKIPIKNKPNEILEQLEFFGIVRHTMLKEIIDIRNVLEHQFSQPPEIVSCKNYCEICWYFLRLTDNYLANYNESMLTETGISKLGMRCNSSILFLPNDGWPLIFDITIDESLIIEDYNENVINLDVNKERDIKMSFDEYLKKDSKSKYFEYMRDGKKELHITGPLKGPSEAINKIIRMYFLPF